MAIYDNRICHQCGKNFSGGPRAWYCPDCRYQRGKERAAKYRKKGYERHIGETDICKRCGQPYIINSGLQRFCPDCGEINAKEIDRKQGLDYFRNNKIKIAEMRFQKRHLGTSEQICIVCGKKFMGYNHYRYCSDECRKIVKNEYAAEYRKKEKERRDFFMKYYEKRNFAISEARKYVDVDAFLSDMSNSSVFADDWISDNEFDAKTINWLTEIYWFANASTSDIRKKYNLSRAAFSKRFNIPVRTIENWETDKKDHHECPIYLKLAIYEILRGKQL